MCVHFSLNCALGRQLFFPKQPFICVCVCVSVVYVSLTNKIKERMRVEEEEEEEDTTKKNRWVLTERIKRVKSNLFL